MLFFQLSLKMNVESAPSYSQHFHPEPGPAAGLVIYLHTTSMGDEVGLDNTGISINTVLDVFL